MNKVFLLLIPFIIVSCKDTKKDYSPKTSVVDGQENTLEYDTGEEYEEGYEYEEEYDNMEDEYGDELEGDDWSGYFVIAQGGLLCRDAPGGEVIHKFSYGEKIDVLNGTDEELTIIDEGEEISGHWVEIYIPDSDLQGYVFDGFLAPSTFDLSAEKIATLTPAVFLEVADQEGVLLAGTHNVYNTELNVIGEIEVNEISDIEIIDATRFERPERKEVPIDNYWEEHCEWANFVTIIYNGEEIIVFGENVLQLTSVEELVYRDQKIELIHAASFLTKTGTLIHELSGCAAGYDFLIKSNNKYSFVIDEFSQEAYSLFFGENEYGSSSIYDETVKNDTIYAKVSQHFQEGVGAYKLKIFEDDGWYFIDYDITRDYEQGN